MAMCRPTRPRSTAPVTPPTASLPRSSSVEPSPSSASTRASEVQRPSATAPRRRAAGRARPDRASRPAAPAPPGRPRRRRWPRGSARRRGRPGPSADRRIQSANAVSTPSASENTSGWSHSAEMRMVTAGRYGSKLPAYSSASTTKSSPAPNRATPRTGPATELGRTAPTNPDGSRPAPTRRWSSQPDVVDLPCVPVTAMSRRPPVAAASAMTCWTLSGSIPSARAATQLRVIGLDGGHGLGHRQPVDDGAPVRVDDVAGVVPPVDRDAGGEHGGRHRVRAAEVAGRHDGARPRGRGGPHRPWPRRRPRARGCACRARSADPGATGRARRRSPGRTGSSPPPTRCEHAAPGRRRRSTSTFPARSPDHWWRRTSAPAASATAT